MNKFEVFRYYKKIITRIILFPLKLMPVNKNRVLLINDMSPHYNDNLKYIGDELRKRNKGIELIYAGYSLDCVDSLKEKQIKPVQLNSLKYFIYGMTSRVLVTNSGGISYLPLNRNQYVLNTWHGGGAYKKMGIDAYEDTPMFRKDMALASRETDVLLTTCKRFKYAYCKAMLESPEKFWDIGMPRNDILKNGDKEKREKIRRELGLGLEDRLVLFAPTYRKQNDDYFNDSIAISYGIDEMRICNALKERFGGDWIFAYRYHPCIVNKQNIDSSNNVIDLTDYDDMQELLLAADVLINDFSSSMWDFMLTGKPCFIFAKDLQHYIDTTDLYTPVSEWPFSIAESNEELVENIKKFNEKSYAVDCKRHYDLLEGCETGEATQIVCDWIENKCDNQRK
jgi:putative glycero-phosphotransferase